MITRSNSVSETGNLAKDFLNNIERKNQAKVVGLRGDLGSAKTTFVKAVAEHLGLKQTVSSPTFVIEKIYKLDSQKFKHLIHIDAYRLEKGEELLNLGWQDISKDPDNLIFIEVACGDNLSEDDIVRLQDDYDRKES